VVGQKVVYSGRDLLPKNDNVWTGARFEVHLGSHQHHLPQPTAELTLETHAQQQAAIQEESIVKRFNWSRQSERRTPKQLSQTGREHQRLLERQALKTNICGQGDDLLGRCEEYGGQGWKERS